MESVEIQEGAIFVADSHYPNHGDEFLLLLKKLESGAIEVTQLFLMGDNFDLLIGLIPSTHLLVREAIDLLQRISQKTPTYYFEGNHDFLLKDILPDVTVFTRQKQPQFMQLGSQSVGLSHGDRYAMAIRYEVFTFLLRSRVILGVMRPFIPWIVPRQIAQLASKFICRTVPNFKEKVTRILGRYPEDCLVIEGHYHQAQVLGRYISLPSLACQKQVGRARNGMIEFVGIDDLSDTF